MLQLVSDRPANEFGKNEQTTGYGYEYGSLGSLVYHFHVVYVIKKQYHIGGLWYKFNTIRTCACVEAYKFWHDQLSVEKVDHT